jgi:2-polyprenyl-3-methyl-5-hydroxy-6-metoxy-1,4-benzoquinol methylase
MFTPGDLHPGAYERNHQFHVTQRPYSVYIERPGQYNFGFAAGLGVVEHVLQDHEAPIRVLDIGAGKGLFLAAAHEAFGDSVELVGMNAENDEADPDVSGSASIQWVDGDFLRPNTWSDRSVHQREGFDLIVSLNTFYQFIDPVAAVARAHRMLKPNGSMFIERLALNLDPDVRNMTLSTITEFFEELDGKVAYVEEKPREYIREGDEREEDIPLATYLNDLYFHKTTGAVPRLPSELRLSHHPKPKMGPTYWYDGFDYDLDDAPTTRRLYIPSEKRPLTPELIEQAMGPTTIETDDLRGTIGLGALLVYGLTRLGER